QGFGIGDAAIAVQHPAAGGRNVHLGDVLAVEGEWWDKDYSGEPLVSFSSEEAHELGLKIGDKVTVNVLGRNITAK
ncbi:hypothetical protein ACC692_39005, partial [Rhizobium ruizarguesonis]